ncbi:hypothetical protein F5890DRAFT_1559207 [Lentinula detonsa]|uniref:CxC6 like cysteine cluster associated with KDZ domain-containing protein n=1 Tax=Lentinula detonsa TaxID=2804962 RepID=A0AA38ULS7_9AGAR|nr:hypothetical protein F5890DRAFT_1559207 [Lentinula detonsa]
MSITVACFFMVNSHIGVASCTSCAAVGCKNEAREYQYEDVPIVKVKKARKADDMPDYPSKRMKLKSDAAIRSPKPLPTEVNGNDGISVSVPSLVSPETGAIHTTAPNPSPMLDLAHILKDHPTSFQLLTFVEEHMSAVVRVCPYHQVMTGTQPGHNRLWKCSTPLLSNNKYEFKKIFTVNLKAEQGSCCFNCWTPQDDVFFHDKQICKGSGRSDWEGWWRGLPYLVWRTTYLRQLVFAELGIPSNSFSNAVSYAMWLTKPAHHLLDPEFDLGG